VLRKIIDILKKKGVGFIVFWFDLVLDWGEVGVEVDFLFLFLKGWGSLSITLNPPKSQKDEVYPPYNPSKKKLVPTPHGAPIKD
jgi:hypothetical protein